MIRFGKIVNVHGLKGDVKILTNSDFAQERLQKGKQLYLADNHVLTIENARLSKTTWIVKFQDLNRIEDVEQYKNKDLFVEEMNLLEEDEFYYADLIGLSLIAKGEVIGTVRDVVEVGSGHNLVCQGETRFQIPFIHSFVGEIDFTEKTIEIFPIPGLID
ncbi:MAG: ribosome maturation factor RimM [Culicoidibacterales bacterium]